MLYVERFNSCEYDMGAWMGVNRITNWGPYLLLNNELEPYFLTISE